MLTAIFILSVMVVAILLMIANVWSTMRTNNMREKYKLNKTLLLNTQLINTLENILKLDIDAQSDIDKKKYMDNIALLKAINKKMEDLIDAFE